MTGDRITRIRPDGMPERSNMTNPFADYTSPSVLDLEDDSWVPSVQVNRDDPARYIGDELELKATDLQLEQCENCGVSGFRFDDPSNPRFVVCAGQENYDGTTDEGCGNKYRINWTEAKDTVF